jgi:hypothetical protein
MCVTSPYALIRTSEMQEALFRFPRGAASRMSYKLVAHHVGYTIATKELRSCLRIRLNVVDEEGFKRLCSLQRSSIVLNIWNEIAVSPLSMQGMRGSPSASTMRLLYAQLQRSRICPLASLLSGKHRPRSRIAERNGPADNYGFCERMAQVASTPRLASNERSQGKSCFQT